MWFRGEWQSTECKISFQLLDSDLFELEWLGTSQGKDEIMLDYLLNVVLCSDLWSLGQPQVYEDAPGGIQVREPGPVAGGDVQERRARLSGHERDG